MFGGIVYLFGGIVYLFGGIVYMFGGIVYLLGGIETINYIVIHGYIVNLCGDIVSLGTELFGDIVDLLWGHFDHYC